MPWTTWHTLKLGTNTLLESCRLNNIGTRHPGHIIGNLPIYHTLRPGTNTLLGPYRLKSHREQAPTYYWHSADLTKHTLRPDTNTLLEPKQLNAHWDQAPTHHWDPAGPCRLNIPWNQVPTHYWDPDNLTYLETRCQHITGTPAT